ncbi:MAG: hypothetical protein KBF45_02665 [Cyclobacteriaceae bacterium]|jgi:hypothetical protein|nr:hypothetical protein [Cyclobacteriaceae bacterium]
MKKNLPGLKIMTLLSFIVWISNFNIGGWPLLLSTLGFVGFLIMLIVLQFKKSKTKDQSL